LTPTRLTGVNIAFSRQRFANDAAVAQHDGAVGNRQSGTGALLRKQDGRSRLRRDVQPRSRWT